MSRGFFLGGLYLELEPFSDVLFHYALFSEITCKVAEVNFGTNILDAQVHLRYPLS